MKCPPGDWRGSDGRLYKPITIPCRSGVDDFRVKHRLLFVEHHCGGEEGLHEIFSCAHILELLHGLSERHASAHGIHAGALLFGLQRTNAAEEVDIPWPIGRFKHNAIAVHGVNIDDVVEALSQGDAQDAGALGCLGACAKEATIPEAAR